jgi:threonine dehydrogenase-like Zn-dependent dehydrogenase
MYYTHFEMMLRNRDRFPWEKLITHRFVLDQCHEALKEAFGPNTLKVEFVP